MYFLWTYDYVQYVWTYSNQCISYQQTVQVKYINTKLFQCHFNDNSLKKSLNIGNSGSFSFPKVLNTKLVILKFFVLLRTLSASP